MIAYNWINKGMPFKQSFSLNNNPFVAGVNYHPGDNFWSNTQANAQNVATQDISIKISGFIGMDRETTGYEDFVINQQFVGESPLASGVAGSSRDKKRLNKAWNSDIARLYIPDVVYANASGVLTFLGGGGADVGFALPLRGQDAGKVYMYGILKGKAGLHGGVSTNVGGSYYHGPVHLFDFDATFKGKSSGIEGDYIIGASISAGEYDRYGNTLISIDIGVGPGIGGSINIGAETYTTPLFRLW